MGLPLIALYDAARALQQLRVGDPQHHASLRGLGLARHLDNLYIIFTHAVGPHGGEDGRRTRVHRVTPSDGYAVGIERMLRDLLQFAIDAVLVVHKDIAQHPGFPSESSP